MPKRTRSLESDISPSIPKRRKGATPQASEGCNISSPKKCATPQMRARVLRANGETFAKRTEPPIVVLDSSDEETHMNTPSGGDKSRTDVPSPMRSHISDSDTDGSSLHSLKSLQRRSRAEKFAREYNPGDPDFSESDGGIEHGNTTESSFRSGEDNHRNYPIRYLEARQKELEDGLEKVKEEIEQGKAKVLELTGHLFEMSQSINALKNLATISSAS